MPVVSTKTQGHARIVTLDRAPHNHVSRDVIAELADAFEQADADPSCRVLVLRSEGRHFCAGADLAQPSDATLGGAQAAPGSHIYTEALRLFRCRKPSIAVLQGAAVGAGFALALVADFRIAAPSAWLSANFTRLGFHPGMGLSVSLPHLVGAQKAKRLLLTGRRVEAAEALALGLVDEVADDPLTTAMAWADELAQSAPLAVVSTRASLRRGLLDALEPAIERERVEQTWQLQTADCREAIAAANERRAPHFTGR